MPGCWLCSGGCRGLGAGVGVWVSDGDGECVVIFMPFGAVGCGLCCLVSLFNQEKRRWRRELG